MHETRGPLTGVAGCAVGLWRQDVEQGFGSEKILVCVGRSASSAGVIRSVAKRARSLNAEWFAVNVQEPRTMMLTEPDHDHAMDNLRLADQLGAKIGTLSGRGVAEEIVNFAREHGITRIVTGKPMRSRLKSFFFRSPVDQLTRISGDIKIEVIPGEREEPGAPVQAAHPIRRRQALLSDFGTGILYWLIATGLCFWMYPYFDLSNLIMVYLLGVLVTAIDCGRGPAILVSLISVLSFDVCFVPPRWSITVEEAQYIVTFIVMFVVALAISHLAAMTRKQTLIARSQEKQAEAMHHLSRKLAGARGASNIAHVAEKYISEIFDSRVMVLLQDKGRRLNVSAGDLSSVFQDMVVSKMNIARSVLETRQMAGPQNEEGVASEIIYLPLIATEEALGVLVLRPRDPKRFLLGDELYLLESLAKQVALALEVEYLTGDTRAPTSTGV